MQEKIEHIKKRRHHPLTLAFPPDMEREFIEYYFSTYLFHMRVSMILGMVIWGLFGLFDWWTVSHDITHHLMFIRYGVVWSIMVGCYLTCFTKQPSKWVGLGISMGILSPAFAIIIKMLLTPLGMTSYWNASLITVFIYGYMVMRARFIWATITGAIILAAYLIAAVWIKNMPYDMLINNIFMIMMGNLLGMYVCYTMESFVRRNFVSAKLLEEEAHRTKRANEQLQQEIEVRLKAEAELQRHKDHLEFLVAERTKELDDTQHEIVYMLGEAAEYRDTETGEHIKRMSRSCALLAREMDCDEQSCDLLLYASQMHDIGKIGIADAILLKPGKLDPEEWKKMKKHTTIGANILSGNDSKLLQMAKVVAISHHERWDGSGYPNGLSREEIPLLGRIVAICDVFDALLSNRPYKKAWPVQDAIDEIDRLCGSHFDPRIYHAFKKILPEVLKDHQS